MKGLGPWVCSLLGAGAFHVVLGWALLVSVAPETRLQRSSPRLESRLDLAVVAVPQAEAREVAKAGDAVSSASLDMSPLTSGTLVASRAHPQKPEGVAVAAMANPPPVRAVETPAARVSASVPAAKMATSIAPATEPVPEVPSALGPAAAPLVPPAGIAATLSPAGVTVRPLMTEGEAAPKFSSATPVSILAPTETEAARVVAPHVLLAAAAAAMPTVPAGVPEAAVVPHTVPDLLRVGAALPREIAASEAPRDGVSLSPRALDTVPAPEVIARTHGMATVAAFSADLATSLSEAALDAVEAFLVVDPGAEGQALRDGIKERLAGVACARVQTAFDPDIGVLELRGHVPEPGDRLRLANAVAAELRGALPVVDRLLELPRPQCEVLSGLAAAGIPQSTEQFTNPLIIGQDSHARVYDFREGDVMQLDIGGADYDGWLYLDYYDSAGEVLHLTPNEVVPPVRLPARMVAQFGGGGTADIAEGRVRLEVGAPFGKDIAVALVTSAPLFDDLRPMREPVADYLAALTLRVEDLRGRNPDFKAEWVYLFVSTAP